MILVLDGKALVVPLMVDDQVGVCGALLRRPDDNLNLYTTLFPAGLTVPFRVAEVEVMPVAFVVIGGLLPGRNRRRGTV